jgi:hypothetical protein
MVAKCLEVFETGECPILERTSRSASIGGRLQPQKPLGDGVSLPFGGGQAVKRQSIYVMALYSYRRWRQALFVLFGKRCPYILPIVGEVPMGIVPLDEFRP